MSSPSVGKLTNADASARMLRSSVATLGCAFVMVMAASVAVVLAITGDANWLEAERQRDRIEAAIESQVRLRELRFQSMAAAGDLHGPVNGPTRWRRSRRRSCGWGRAFEFDGAYVVSVSGLFSPASKATARRARPGCDGLKHFSPSLPGGRAGGPPLWQLPDMRGGPGNHLLVADP